MDDQKTDEFNRAFNQMDTKTKQLQESQKVTDTHVLSL